ncbi:FAD-dependent oxidoreductase [Corynebacterium heidelbergense]|uniref:Oxidoreductase n=1 Tax=Corynebacterium heidelbergense TaxID=2055947 RepID=A0A364VE08_9CORY|nr:FAD-dependent oxidoreductase [Corynebacterium heidelbergense]RAV34844.1 oxidoreductase [Corynebacterium heidelbergense]WCZ36924.1 hypothetical protein CHEID_06955 [Corynebacterium heidelbergense]
MSDVAVVGGGMAGLAAARSLCGAGLNCTVFESSNSLGGKVGSTRIDDITVDYGFQAFNSWYPAIKEALKPGEYASLGIKSFKPAIQTLTPDGLALIVDPIRAPHMIPQLLRSQIISALSVRDSFALQAWLRSEYSHRSSLERRSVRKRRRAKDVPVSQSLDRSRVTNSLRRVAVDPMLRAFLYDTDGQSSAQFAKWLFVTLMRGTLGVPEHGMGDLADMMSRIPGATFELNSPVERIYTRPSGPRAGVDITVAGRTRHFDYAVVAIPQRAQATLLNTTMVPTRSVSTWWFAADENLPPMPFITVDGTGMTPIASATEVTAVAPAYAPGRKLVAATVVHERPLSGAGRGARDPELPSVAEMRQFLGLLWGVDASRWEDVTRQDIADASPIVAPGMAMRSKEELQLVDGRLGLAGEYHATPTVDGAMRSGQRAAKQIIAAAEAAGPDAGPNAASETGEGAH